MVFRPKYDFRAWLWLSVNCSCFLLIFILLHRVVAEFCGFVVAFFSHFVDFLSWFGLISHRFGQFLFDLVEFGSIAFHFRQFFADFCLFWPIFVWFWLFSAVFFTLLISGKLVADFIQVWIDWLFLDFIRKILSSTKSHIYSFWVFQKYLEPMIAFRGVMNKWYLDPKMAKKLLK